MRASQEGAHSGIPPVGLSPLLGDPAALLGHVLDVLDVAKAEDVVAIDLSGKSSLADHMVIASGRSHRQVGAIADRVAGHLKDLGYGRARIEGLQQCDWVLIDTGDIIVHIFRPEVRAFYNLEKMWAAERPADRLAV